MGSIEATIPSSLCSGPLGVLSNEDTLGDNQNDEALGALQGTLQDLQNSPEDIQGSHNHQLNNTGQNQGVGEFGASFWVDDMAGFPLPPLDLDPLPPGLFSPCSATYKWVLRLDCIVYIYYSFENENKRAFDVYSLNVNSILNPSVICSC